MSFWQECHKPVAGPLQCITSEGSQCKCVDFDHLVLERCFFEGSENPFGFLEITSLPQKASPPSRRPTPQSHSLSQPQGPWLITTQPAWQPIIAVKWSQSWRCDLHNPQGLLRWRPVQQRCGKNCGPGLNLGCSSHHVGLGLTRTVERVVRRGGGKRTKEIWGEMTHTSLWAIKIY